jgi:hypothetical protein
MKDWTLNPRVESTVREISLRVYLHSNDDDYDASCQVQILNTTGFVHSITGSGFYLALNLLFNECRKYGLKTLTGFVLKPHARLLKMQAAKLSVSVEIHEPEEAHQRMMSQVVIHL